LQIICGGLFSRLALAGETSTFVNSGGGESVKDSESVRVVDEQTLVVAGGCGSGFILAPPGARRGVRGCLLVAGLFHPCVTCELRANS